MFVDLDRLAGLAEKATPGPYSWNPSGDDPECPRMFLEATGRDYRHVLKIAWPELLSDENAAYLAASDPQTVLALVRAVRAAQALPDAIQERKHSAQLATSRCASESDWDMEEYWRARAEGLAEAETVVRESLAPFAPETTT